MERFADKIMLVTGSAGGIGLATTEQFTREVATIIAFDRDEVALDRAIAKFAVDGGYVAA